MAEMDRLFLLFLKLANFNTQSRVLMRGRVFYRQLYHVFSILVCTTGLVKQGAKHVAASITASFTSSLPLKRKVKLAVKLAAACFTASFTRPVLQTRMENMP